MRDPVLTRRALLRRGAAGIGGLSAAALCGCGAGGSACVDEDLLSTPERVLRERWSYTSLAAEGATQTCRACRFFTPTSDLCGHCQILDGPVDSRGRCDAWSSDEVGEG